MNQSNRTKTGTEKGEAASVQMADPLGSILAGLAPHIQAGKGENQQKAMLSGTSVDMNLLPQSITSTNSAAVSFSF